MKFAPAKAQRSVLPLRVVVLPPSAFADDWPQKPSDEVAIGLRFLSQADVDAGRREAMREASGFYAELRDTPIPADPDASVDVHNDTLVMYAVARGTCDPNDVTKPYFVAAEDTVKIALTPEGARRIYDELVILTKGYSPGLPAASDADVRSLGNRLRRGAIPLDDESRKLIGYLLSKHGGLDEAEGDDEDDDVAVYSMAVVADA